MYPMERGEEGWVGACLPGWLLNPAVRAAWPLVESCQIHNKWESGSDWLSGCGKGNKAVCVCVKIC